MSAPSLAALRGMFAPSDPVSRLAGIEAHLEDIATRVRSLSQVLDDVAAGVLHISDDLLSSLGMLAGYLSGEVLALERELGALRAARRQLQGWRT